MFRIPIAAVALVVLVACGDAATPTTQAPAATTTTAPPATAAPTTAAPTTTEAGIVPGEDPEVDAIVEAFAIAFDTTSTFEAKSAFIDDPSGLESVVERYIETGESLGGVEVLATAVEINGDEAVVFYDLLFGGNPTYPDLEGKAVKTADGWKVPRAIFCGLMASARVPCS